MRSDDIDFGDMILLVNTMPINNCEEVVQSSWYSFLGERRGGGGVLSRSSSDENN